MHPSVNYPIEVQSVISIDLCRSADVVPVQRVPRFWNDDSWRIIIPCKRKVQRMNDGLTYFAVKQSNDYPSQNEQLFQKI